MNKAKTTTKATENSYYVVWKGLTPQLNHSDSVSLQKNSHLPCYTYMQPQPHAVGTRQSQLCADNAAKAAFSTRLSSMNCPATDLYPELTKHYHSNNNNNLKVWQTEWDRCSSNKLHSQLGYYSIIYLICCDAEILRRLNRIAHTRVTHKYLLSGDDKPLCDECKSPLTVRHIPLECYSLQNVHEKHFKCSSLKEVFENVYATTIIPFIKEINYYHLL